jgi:hypothetical protein
MDDKLFSFAEIYELETLGRARARIRAPTPAVPRAGLGARLRSQIGRATQAVGRGARAGAARAAGAARSTFLRSQKVTPAIKNMLNKFKIRGVRDAKGKLKVQARVTDKAGRARVVDVDSPEALQALKGAGYSLDDIATARSQALKQMFNNELGSQISAFQKAVGRGTQRFEGLYVRTMGGARTPIRNMIAAHPALAGGIVVGTGLTVLSMILSGRPPAATSKESQQIVQSVPNPGMPIIPDIIKRTDAVIKLAQGQEAVVQSLNAVKTAMTELNGTQVNLDDPNSAQGYTQKVRAAEDAANSALLQLSTFVDKVQGAGQAQIQQLQGALGEFLLEILAVRGIR